MKAPPAISPDDLVELDLNTWEKLPALARHLDGCAGPALDLGSGLAFYSRRLLAGAGPVVAADLDLSALGWARGPIRAGAGNDARAGVQPCAADAGRLPFRPARFATVLLADVLEHCPDDRVVLAEIARVLRPSGRLVLVVPSMEWGFPDFLSLLGVTSVHDREGPEHHFRPGYTAGGLAALLARAGMELEAVEPILRLGGKLMVDAVALAHLAVERLGSGRTAWTWGQLLAAPPPGLRLYRRLFPAVRGLFRLARRLGPARGFELVATARRC